MYLCTLPDDGSYTTITARSEAVFRDRGSRFIGVAVPLNNEGEFRRFLEGLRKEFPAARHYCYAWRFGVTGERVRANDDGEPSGTAGRPILAQIIASGLTDVAVAVVRYFGGTLLGTGGLINAYRAAAQLALEGAAREERFIVHDFRAMFPPEDMSAVLRLLRTFEAEIIQNQFTTQHELVFRVKNSHAEELIRKFADIYRASLQKLSL